MLLCGYIFHVHLSGNPYETLPYATYRRPEPKTHPLTSNSLDYSKHFRTFGRHESYQDCPHPDLVTKTCYKTAFWDCKSLGKDNTNMDQLKSSLGKHNFCIPRIWNEFHAQKYRASLTSIRSHCQHCTLWIAAKKEWWRHAFPCLQMCFFNQTLVVLRELIQALRILWAENMQHCDLSRKMITTKVILDFLNILHVMFDTYLWADWIH